MQVGMFLLLIVLEVGYAYILEPYPFWVFLLVEPFIAIVIVLMMYIIHTEL